MATRTGRSAGTRKYGKTSGRKVERAMHEMKQGTLRSGRSGKKVKSRKQAVAIGLSEARRAGAKVPKRKAKKKAATGRKASSAKKASTPRRATIASHIDARMPVERRRRVL